jgi:hypothetical protein
MPFQKKATFRSDQEVEIRPDSRSSGGDRPVRARLAKMLGRWIELLVLLLVVISPWLFGGVEPVHEFWLFALLAVALVFWGLRVLLEGAVPWRPCRVLFCMLALIYLGFMQLVPLPAQALRTLSPATARTFEFLLPDQPEALQPDKVEFATQKVEKNTLSFYRSATAQTICRLLAALCLFALVRNNITARGGLLRLSIVAVINGAALSLVAMLQLFSSLPNEVYWTYKAPAVVFGPFICRNHFPFYINCCIGLGLGLLVYTQGSKHASDSSRNGSSHSGHRRHRSPHSLRSDNGAQTQNHDTSLVRPETLWLGIGLALMISAVMLSLSRGGVVVLFATSLLGLILLGRSLFRLSRSASGVLIAAAGAFCLLSWFGFNLFKERLETLWKSGGLEARTPLWSSCLPLMGEFPVFGTGYGTFQLVEPLHRAYVSEEFNQLIFAHAHNEFIEAAVEGGALRLAISLAAIGFVFAAGYRILRPQKDASGGLAAGALFAFTTVVLHGAGDFGMHVPAITILIAVLAAYIMGLAEDLEQPQGGSSKTSASRVRMIRWGGLAPLLAASLLIGIGLLLVAQSYHWQVVHRYLTAGLQRTTSTDLAQQERRIEYLKTAAALAPEFAGTEMELGQAYYEAYSSQQNRVSEMQTFAEICEAVLSFQYRDGTPASRLRFIASLKLTDAGWQAYSAAREVEFEKAYLAQSLRYFIIARDLCPLLGKPHARLAAHRELLARGDDSQQYMERVRYLRKYDPEVWYISGILELAALHPEIAWENWKRSLELSDAFLMDIVHRSLTVLPVDELLTKVLPDNPAQILRTGTELYPMATEKAQREPFITRALELLDKPGRLLTASERHTKAKSLYLAGKTTDALAAYRVAIQYNPTQVELRLEYAQLLHELGYVREARWELTGILDSDPGNSRAQVMLGEFDRKESPKER